MDGSVLNSYQTEKLIDVRRKRSGFTMWSIAVGPLELYDVIVSSKRSGVPFVFIAPSVMTYGSLPGAVIVPYPL